MRKLLPHRSQPLIAKDEHRGGKIYIIVFGSFVLVATLLAALLLILGKTSWILP